MNEMTEELSGFAALGLHEQLLRALDGLGYEEPTPIQSEAIPPLLEGRDLLGQAATGTGKTAAFALPLLQKMIGQPSETAPRALVLVPTRELAMQVAEAVHRYGREMRVRVLPIYGGQPIGRQLRALRSGVDVIVATPGRALDHIGRGTLSLASARVVVLDEADEMLDMGFAEDIEAILAEAPAERQTVLFSATMPPRVDAISRRHLRNPVKIQIDRQPMEPGSAPLVRQIAYVVPRAHKLTALGRVLDMEAPTAALVFCRTRTEVDELTVALSGRGYRAEALHGGLSQEQRDRVMARLRAGTSELLIATDVAARGLDIEHLSHAINYDVPSAPEAYVHRTGRVGRAGREGVAITLLEPREHRLLRNIERLTRQRITVAQVPTVADLLARRMELTRAALREAILAGEAQRYRVVVEALADEFDPMEVAMAAVKLVHEADGESRADQDEIPQVPLHRERAPHERRPAHGRFEPRDGRGDERATRGARFAAGGAPARGSRPQGGMAVLHIGAGRNLGIRPQDLVGAIANEAGVHGRAIGAIEIADRYSLVEVAAEVASDVVSALRRTTVKGRKVAVRRESQRDG
jgi:ATP-dependent RNA helicase DeaD